MPATFKKGHWGNRSPVERVYWEALQAQRRDARLRGFDVRGQRQIDRIRVDFGFVHSDGRRLVVEIDGVGHSVPQQRDTDRRRDELVVKLGFAVLRIQNEEVLADIDQCVERTLVLLQKLPRRSKAQLDALDESYRQSLAQSDFYRRWPNRLSRVTILDPRGDSERRALYLVHCHYEKKLLSTGSNVENMILRDVQRAVLRELHLQLDDDPLPSTREQLRRKYLRTVERDFKERMDRLKSEKVDV